MPILGVETFHFAPLLTIYILTTIKVIFSPQNNLLWTPVTLEFKSWICCLLDKLFNLSGPVFSAFEQCECLFHKVVEKIENLRQGLVPIIKYISTGPTKYLLSISICQDQALRNDAFISVHLFLPVSLMSSKHPLGVHGMKQSFRSPLASFPALMLVSLKQWRHRRRK